MTLTTET